MKTAARKIPAAVCVLSIFCVKVLQLRRKFQYNKEGIFIKRFSMNMPFLFCSRSVDSIGFNYPYENQPSCLFFSLELLVKS